MKLSKNTAVMKSLVETILRTNRKANFIYVSDEEVTTALRVLKAILNNNTVNIIADVERVAEHFSATIDVKYRWVNDHTDITNLAKEDQTEFLSVVVLHSGDRTVAQKERYYDLLEHLKYRDDVIVWHVGRWS